MNTFNNIIPNIYEMFLKGWIFQIKYFSITLLFYFFLVFAFPHLSGGVSYSYLYLPSLYTHFLITYHCIKASHFMPAVFLTLLVWSFFPDQFRINQNRVRGGVFWNIFRRWIYKKYLSQKRCLCTSSSDWSPRNCHIRNSEWNRSTPVVPITLF